MKKVALIVLGMFLFLIIIVLIKGPGQPVCLTDEEVAAKRKEFNQKFSNLNLSGFETKNLNGKKINSDIFKDSKVTMINIFTTWCSPCKAEMPDIGKLYQDLPEGSNVIGICADAGESKKKLKIAQEIMKDSKANFDVLIPDRVLNKQLLKDVTIFPTTIFVDSEGNIIGDVYIHGEQSEEAYRQEVIKRLNLLAE